VSKILKWTAVSIVVLIVIAYSGLRLLGPGMLEKALNKQLAYTPLTVTTETQQLHDTLQVMDWHADTLLWNRDFLDRADRGQVDLPRLTEGGIGFQMLTAVTKSPRGQNYSENSTEAPDNITSLAVVQGWPVATWGSLLKRALFQADKLRDVVARSGGSVRWIKSQSDLEAHLQNQSPALAVFLGTEGAHPLEGELTNIDKMADAGYRRFGITHFFDNELAGSLHGQSKSGLTDFGRAAIQRFDELELIIDLAHVSEKAAYEILEISNRAPVVSHTGFKGNCNTPRNFSDALMKAIADKGGIIAVGMWDAAVCDPTPTGIAKAIKYGIELVGEDHVALGSDWDGSVTAMTSDAVPQITQALVNEGVSPHIIRKVMGENSVKFMQKWLPKD